MAITVSVLLSIIHTCIIKTPAELNQKNKYNPTRSYILLYHLTHKLHWIQCCMKELDYELCECIPDSGNQRENSSNIPTSVVG